MDTDFVDKEFPQIRPGLRKSEFAEQVGRGQRAPGLRFLLTVVDQGLRATQEFLPLKSNLKLAESSFPKK